MNPVSLLIHAQAEDQASDEPIAPPKRRPRWQMPYGAPRRPSEFQKSDKPFVPEWATDPGKLPKLPPGRK